MAREGISFEQVSAAAEALVAEGQSPTIRAIRDAIGSGSPNTIHRHLASWRASRPAPKTEAPRLPDELTGALVQALERSAARARAEIEQRLVEALAETQELAAAGERTEAEALEAMEGLDTAKAELERQGGELSAAQASIAELRSELEREKSAAEAARIEAAKLALKAERLDEISAELTRERTARSDAEKQLAVAESELRGAQKSVEAAEARATQREQSAEARAQDAEKRALAAAKTARDALSQAAAAEARAEALERLLPTRKPVSITESRGSK